MEKIKETDKIQVTYKENNKKIINGYLIEKVIGKGSYAKVKLGIKDGKEYVILYNTGSQDY
jgi:hypothetical protein